MTLQVQKENSQKQKIAKGVRTIAIFAGVTGIVAVASFGLGIF